ncbi:MAG: hypothetical protein U0802_06530 [Candidatus Binatia bacterium]
MKASTRNPGGEHQHVERVQRAVARAHARRLDARDGLGDQARVGTPMASQFSDITALAAGAVGGTEPFAQRRVEDVVLQVGFATGLDRPVISSESGSVDAVREALGVGTRSRRGSCAMAFGVIAEGIARSSAL